MIGIIVQLAALVATSIAAKIGYDKLMSSMEKKHEKTAKEYYNQRTQVTCPMCRTSELLEDAEKELMLFQCNMCGALWEDYPTHSIVVKINKIGDKR